MRDIDYADFLDSFNSTQNEEISLPKGLNTSDFIRKWISAEKHPIVIVQRLNGSIILHQTSYSGNTSKSNELVIFGWIEDEFILLLIYFSEDEESKQTWSIPISFTNSTTRNFNSNFDYWILEDNFTIIHNAYSTNEDDSWVVVNALGKGYYRSNYDRGKYYIKIALFISSNIIGSNFKFHSQITGKQ